MTIIFIVSITHFLCINPPTTDFQNMQPEKNSLKWFYAIKNNYNALKKSD